MKNFAVAVVVTLSALCIMLAALEIAAPFWPHAFYGITFGFDGRVARVYPAELPSSVHIAPGDRVLDFRAGNALGTYFLRVPHLGDQLHVATPNGVVTVTAKPNFYLPGDALGEVLRNSTGAVLIACAAFLFVKRPGRLALGFWIWSLASVGGGDIDYAIDWMPRTPAFILDTIYYAVTYSGLSLVSFALRFPNDVLTPRLRRVDTAVWWITGLLFVLSAYDFLQSFMGGGVMTYHQNDFYIAALLTLIAAGVLIWRQTKADAAERSRLAWASFAFVGAALLRGASFVVADLRADSSWRYILAASDVMPLFAIYPILRYRLFDLGFIVSRAAVFSAISVAIFASLAGVNWLVQHFVTERLAFFLQPVAAILVGLGYFRIRGWAQNAIERILFREHLAAEEHLNATVRGLPYVERPQAVDDVLLHDVPQTLQLASAALFRLEGGRFVGEARAFASDDPLARQIRADGPIVALPASDEPDAPAIALGIVRRGTLWAIVLYGRHANGTELEPDELRLIGRVGRSAAVAYETAEAVTMRERIAVLEERLRAQTAR